MATLTLGGWDRTIAPEAVAQLRHLLAEHFDVIYADLDLEAIAELEAISTASPAGRALLEFVLADLR